MRLRKASLGAGGYPSNGVTPGLQSYSFPQWPLCHPLVTKEGNKEMNLLQSKSAVREAQEHSHPADGRAVCFAGMT